MKLITTPDDSVTPIVQAIRSAKASIDIVIFRFDRAEIQKALVQAVARGVTVRALVANTNRGGEKRLRKLELQFLEAGITVARTADDLTRYHGKLMIIDGVLYVLGFNYTKLDIDKSRSFGLELHDAKLVKAAQALFEADVTRQPYVPQHDRLVVSPETSRPLLSKFISGAKKQLLIYDIKFSDKLMLKLVQERAKAGVEVRVIGRIEKSIEGVESRRLAEMRLHLRLIIRDHSQVFLGSQSLRKLQLDGRREVGVIVADAAIAKKMTTVFESDWAQSGPKRERETVNAGTARL